VKEKMVWREKIVEMRFTSMDTEICIRTTARCGNKEQ
jgi:hypothetical protein